MGLHLRKRKRDDSSTLEEVKSIRRKIFGRSPKLQEKVRPRTATRPKFTAQCRRLPVRRSARARTASVYVKESQNCKISGQTRTTQVRPQEVQNFHNLLQTRKMAPPQRNPPKRASKQESTRSRGVNRPDTRPNRRPPRGLQLRLLRQRSRRTESGVPISSLPKAPTTSTLQLASSTSKDGQDPENTPAVLYIGRIPHGFHEAQMRAYFSQFGAITQLRLARNKKTGKSQHYAFIEFASQCRGGYCEEDDG